MYFQCEQKQFNDFLDGFVPKAKDKLPNKRSKIVTPATPQAQRGSQAAAAAAAVEKSQAGSEQHT